MRWALPLVVIASMANAQALSTSIRSGGLSPQRFPSAASDSALLRFLPSVSASDECTGASLTGTKGQALTFTRGSSAYCTKTDGTMVLLTSNQPRLEGNGLLVEETRTNLVLRSQELDNASWSKVGTAVVTANTGSAPDGTATADRVQLPSVGAAVQQVVGGAYESQTHTVSVYVKSNTGGNQTFRIKLTHAAVLDYFSGNLTATTSWQRFTFSQAFTAAVGTGANVGLVMDASNTATDLLAWGYQLEKNVAFQTSYIATTGTSATRASEAASFSVAFPEAEGCTSASLTIPAAVTSGTKYVIATSGGANNDAMTYLNSAGTAVGVFAFTGGGPTASASLLGATSVVRSAWRTLPSLLGAIQVNGGTLATQAAVDFAASSTLCLGSTCVAGAFYTGHIKALILESSYGGCQ